MLAALKVTHEKNWKRLGVLEHFHLPDRALTPVALLADHATSFLVLSLSSFLFGFSVSAGPCDRFPCASSLILSLLVDAGCSVGVTVSCDEEVGEDEGEELIDRPRTTMGTQFCVAIDLPAIFDEMWFLTSGPMLIKPVIFAEFSE